MTIGTEIAIVGMAGRFPGAQSVSAFWEVLKSGRETIKPSADEPTAQHGANGHWVKVNSLLQDVDLFDAGFFGFSPREAEMMDPQHRIFLECAWEALEDAGVSAGDTHRHVGVFAGAALSAYIFNFLQDGAHLLDTLPAMLANDKDYLATRISYKLNFSGPALTVQCACSTSLAAVHLACQSLIAGECDAALAGGISIALPRVDRYFYIPGSILSPDGRCRAFDAKARGTAFAEGVGIVVLMRLEDALRANHHIYAVILGSAVNNDAALKVGYTAPSIEGQFAVIRQAQAVAGISPADVSYIEAHGTGTVLGDAVELAALTKVFRAATSDVGICALGSVKTNIGHLSTAAGVAGLIKTALALEHRLLPASLNFEEPNPDLDLAHSPFYVNTDLAPWPAASGQPRYAGVSSFGVGGTNAHVVMTQPPEQPSSPSTRRWHLLPLSAKTESALAHAGARLKDHLRTGGKPEFANLVYTQQIGRRAFEHRAVVVCADAEDAAGALAGAAAEQMLTGKAAATPPTVAFMFPGQGTQYVAMGADLYRTEPTFRECVDECAQRLERALDLDLRTLLYCDAGAAEAMNVRLQDTALAQPALFVVEYALSKLLQSWGIRPAAMIGHSIGEYVAACCAEVLSLEDALRLVAARGRLMQAMPPGGMLSVALAPNQLQPLLNGEIDLAAVNAPQQCVVAGPLAALTQLELRLADRAIACRRLRTSHAFHSLMMEPMLGAYAQELERVELRPPKIGYIANPSGEFITAEQATAAGYWLEQIRRPVLFAKGIESLAARGIEILLEVGPGRSLSTLASQCDVQPRGIHMVNAMRDARAGGADDCWLMRALGKLWLAGAAVDWPALYGAEQRMRVSAPAYPFERQRYWSEVESLRKQRSSHFEKQTNVADWFYAPSWKRLRRLGDAGTGGTALDGYTVVFCDRFGLGDAVAEVLRSGGAAVATVASGAEAAADHDYTVHPSEDADYERLFKQMGADGRRPAQIVHLWGLDRSPGDGHDAREFRRAQEVGLFSLLRALKAFETVVGVEPLRVEIVAQGLFDVVGSEALVPAHATMLAFTKVVPQEHQNVVCRLFDVDVSERDARTMVDLAVGLARELAVAPAEVIVAVRNGYCWGQRFDPLDVRALAAGAPLKPHGVYLITGGLGRIGLTLARYLARKCGARLVLTGRAPFPDKETWQDYLARDGADDAVRAKINALREIEQDGGEVWVRQANVASAEDMASVRRFIEEQCGRLDGVVFGAGRTTLHRSAFEQTGAQECAAHFEAKVYGLMVLEQMLQDMRVDFCVVLSSLSTVLGGLGHLAYSAANHVADALVHRRNRARADLWITADWDAWQFRDVGGDSPEMRATLMRLAMQPEEGAEAFDWLLRLPVATQYVISTAPLGTRLEDWIKLRSVRSAAEPVEHAEQARRYPRRALGTPYAEPEGDLERQVAKLWQGALGIEQVGRNDDFFEIGGHSLLAMQVLAQIRQVFGIDFPIDRAFAATTVCKAAELVDELLQEKVARLTDDEVEALLRQTPALETTNSTLPAS